MFHVQRIENFDLPELQPYRTMRMHLEHRHQGIFVAEGEKVVRRLLASDYEVVSVLLPERWFVELETVLQARPENISVFVAEKELLETLTGFSMYQGLLAVGKVPQPPKLDDLLARSPRPWLMVAADGLTSAQNLGAVVRNCAALNATALLTSETCCSPFLRRSVRGSMGTIFRLPILETASLTDVLRQLRARKFHCVAAHPHVSNRVITQANLAGDSCIVLGSEGYGLSPEVLALCDDAVAVPMAPEIDSLNVVSAGAIFLYEANRQRNLAGLAPAKIT
jgi:tRNA G18 (ribose-2'-O)-methylase SpoU